VDSQNSFGALIRTRWRIAGVESGGRLAPFYAKFNDDEKGEEQDIARRAKGLPTLAEERLAAMLKAEEDRKQAEMRERAEVAAAQKEADDARDAELRTRLHNDSQEIIRTRLRFPKMARFSTLQPADDQFTASRRYKDNLWETRGVVEYVDRAGKRQREVWRVLTLISQRRGFTRPVCVESPEYKIGSEEEALRLAASER
jgi:hypothetical protein